jgi:hypothetical protein
MVVRPELVAAVAAGLSDPVRPDVAAMAESLAAAHPSLAAVLFYGSALRKVEAGVIPDLYLLVDGYRAFHRRALTAAAGRLLPPNVLFLPANGPDNIGFKAAVMSLEAFRARLRPDGFDTTLWARFSQPSRLVWCRNDAVRAEVTEALADAGAAAAYWAVRLGPERGSSADYWTSLFRYTYGAELRAEGGGRGGEIYGFAAARFDAVLAAAGEGLAHTKDGFCRTLSAADLARAHRAWRRRRRCGKLLNAARLIKAVFTFRGGVDYIVWKLERHSGAKISLSGWQKRHPLLAAPFVLPSLLRRGIVK